MNIGIWKSGDKKTNSAEPRYKYIGQEARVFTEARISNLPPVCKEHRKISAPLNEGQDVNV